MKVEIENILIHMVLLVLAAPIGWQVMKAISSPAFAGTKVTVAVIEVVDGDTFDVAGALVPGIVINERIRPIGFDAPETFRPGCAAERRAGEASTAFLASKILKKQIVLDVSPYKRDKYGRLLATAYLMDGRALADVMIDAGHAREYHGQRKSGWPDLCNKIGE